jgi:hypothetical protein
MGQADFWNCSLWEFSAAVTGWKRANGQGESTEAPTEDEFQRMLERAGLA